jgi:hypothetical protein
VLRLIEKSLIPYSLRYILQLYGTKFDVLRQRQNEAKKKKNDEIRRKRNEYEEQLNNITIEIKNLKREIKICGNYMRKENLKKEKEKYETDKKRIEKKLRSEDLIVKEKDDQLKLPMENDDETYMLALDVLQMLIDSCIQIPTVSKNAKIWEQFCNKKKSEYLRDNLFKDLIVQVFPTTIVINVVAHYCTADNIHILFTLIGVASKSVLTDICNSDIPWILIQALHSSKGLLAASALSRLMEVTKKRHEWCKEAEKIFEKLF